MEAKTRAREGTKVTEAVVSSRFSVVSGSLYNYKRLDTARERVLHDEERVWNLGQSAAIGVDVIRGHSDVAVPAVLVHGDQPQEFSCGIKHRMSGSEVAGIVGDVSKRAGGRVHGEHTAMCREHEFATCWSGQVVGATARTIERRSGKRGECTGIFVDGIAVNSTRVRVRGGVEVVGWHYDHRVNVGNCGTEWRTGDHGQRAGIRIDGVSEDAGSCANVQELIA